MAAVSAPVERRERKAKPDRAAQAPESGLGLGRLRQGFGGVP